MPDASKEQRFGIIESLEYPSYLNLGLMLKGFY
jgi:hypothetical protein